MNAPAVLLGVIVLTVVYVMLPVGFAVFAAWRRPRRLRCPVTDRDTLAVVDAYGAGVAAAFGGNSLRVRECSLWPENSGCGQGCLLGR